MCGGGVEGDVIGDADSTTGICQRTLQVRGERGQHSADVLHNVGEVRVCGWGRGGLSDVGGDVQHVLCQRVRGWEHVWGGQMYGS